jgi:cis-3-alkyl-4-acyloxetan-2-one decarboxylase
MSYPDYPFTGQHFEVRPGIRMHYLDEGPRDAPVVLMLHGNPSWSYYWRRLVLALRGRYRCIVPDHVGMGLSDKPDDAAYAYTLQSRVDDLNTLLQRLGSERDITLAVHDWGGMIGFGWALTHADAIKRLIITNTASFPLPAAKAMPWQLNLGRNTWLGALLIRGVNAFAAGAAKQGVVTPMPADVRRAYCAPYDSWAHRIATLRFVQDIPLSPADRAWSLVEAAGRKLPEFADRPALLGWGLQDFVFDQHFLDGFTRALPKAEVHAYADAGHYVLEDKHAVLISKIVEFLQRNP